MFEERPDRRAILKTLAAVGVGSAVFARALEALAADAPKVTADLVKQAEWISGVALTDAQRGMMLDDLGQAQAGYAKLRAVALDNAVPPAFTIDPSRIMGRTQHPPSSRPQARAPGSAPLPGDETSIAFATAGQLSDWLRRKAISSTELTKLYLGRIAKLDPKLHAVITPTEKLALEQASRADDEIAHGRWRGPLHGVPYGAKDLVAAAGYPTTWGSPLFKDQIFPESAAVIEKLDAAGAVLVAKTSVGELAWGDVWFGGLTRNPWKLEQGSSGSSAGSASLTAAGCVGFAIGTETWGSIVSPSTRCGTSGLRPSFGRVSRRGVMALSWTMDKVGAVARSVADCALVFDAIQGGDPRDPFSRDVPFAWPPARDPKSIRVGYPKALFEADYTQWADKDEPKAGYEQWKTFDARALDVLRRIGYDLVPIDLTFSAPVGPLGAILTAEAASAFDTLVRSGRVDGMVRQTADAWPNVFREGQLIPAVEYIRANRVRTIVMREMAKIFDKVDVYVVPSFAEDNQLLTNLTGNPAVVLPNGFRTTDGTPTSITFQGPLDGDDLALAVANAYQLATDFHTKRPPI
jgi:Asp-tRNA(Asn)/Glu-tRNA(Gln) amidotransferase A subunit family amidase